MPEQKIIPTTSRYSITDSQAVIITEYDFTAGNFPYIKFVQLTNDSGKLENVEYQEGDILLKMTNFPSKVNVSLSSVGDFIVSSSDSVLYSINENGELEYNSVT